MSSMSFTTSLTNEMMKAKPEYTTASLNNLPIAIWIGPSTARFKSHSAMNNTRMTHAVRMEMIKFPMSNFFLKVEEYNINKKTQPALASPIIQLFSFQL